MFTMQAYANRTMPETSQFEGVRDCNDIQAPKVGYLGPRSEFNKVIECVGAISGPAPNSTSLEYEGRKQESILDNHATPQSERYEHTARVTEIVRAFAR